MLIALLTDVSHAAKLPHVKAVYMYTQKHKRKRRRGGMNTRKDRISHILLRTLISYALGRGGGERERERERERESE